MRMRSWGKKARNPLKSLLMIFVVLSMSRIGFPEEPVAF
jgi:hypothetical protein